MRADRAALPDGHGVLVPRSRCARAWCLALCAPLLVAGCGGGGAPAADGAIVLSDFQAASIVFGQPVFALSQANQGQQLPSADSLSRPGKPALGGLYLPDADNNRVLGFRATPVISNLAAAFVLGQPGFAFDGAATAATGMDSPTCAAVGAGRLFVTDLGNHRVLAWHVMPDGNAMPADYALGQPDLITREIGAGPSGLREPMCVAATDTCVVVADTGNNRVLVWDHIPPGQGAPAVVALGQPDFDGTLPNRGGAPAADTLWKPSGVWTDGARVVVADRGNHRVLIWNALPTASGQPADLVLGQPDFTSNRPAAGTTGLSQPADVTGNARQLFVADAGNNRVLVWEPLPAGTAAPAQRVIGQSSFGNTAPNDDDQDGTEDAGPTARTLKGDDGRLTVHVYGTDLFVGDTGNHRMLIFRGQ